MIIDAIQEYITAYHNLSKAITNDQEKQYFVEHADVSKATNLLENLISSKTMLQPAFELLLKINKEEALDIIKSWYLSRNISRAITDPVEDLDIMFTDIKEILGEEELDKLLKNKKFLKKKI
ncbi:hypothetical protein GY065_00895 [Snodgrassella sp. ESL0323]|uniref:hypothetical protein n=1 Tax=Snodgrassella sp. ESL0323 TaxID=2705034 RepID=UPI0015823EB8|nr:hypothetical protein [Snodgrassella sp. ESL0323]NUF77510.1 hypothetical protein [Snodgrassella sp. ESL0323]